jgi:transcriptional antiterminator NusG
MTDNDLTTQIGASSSDEERPDSNANSADPEFRDYEPESESAEQPAAEGTTEEPTGTDSTLAVASDGSQPEAPADDEATVEAAVVEATPDAPVAVADDAVETVEAEAEASDDEEEDEDEEPDYFFAPGDWYVVHTYAGYENKVKANLASRIQSMNMEDKIYDVVVPTEEVMELKSGKMQAVQKKVFPGYILVRMELDDDSWYVVRNTPGVTGFVGSGAKPTPLDSFEVSKILAPKTEDRPKPKLEYEVGEVVSVIGGAFNGYSGPVNAIDVDKQRVTVLLDLFGRETPVELTFDQVTKL